MADLYGFKKYYDAGSGMYTCEKEKSKVEHVPCDSPTSWFADLPSAMKCVERLNKDFLHEIKICKECGEPFVLPDEEIMWYKDRELVPPKRCVTCRHKAKRERENQNPRK